MTAPIEDVSSLPGKEVADQYEEQIGKVKEIYAIDGDGHPTWVTVETKFEGAKRTVFIPLARLKDENGLLQVPYSLKHICGSPEVDGSDSISEECERELRAYYSIDRGDQELRTDNYSYATLVPDGEGTSKRVEDVDQLETPSADKRTDETQARLEDPGSSEIRTVTADDLMEENKKIRQAGERDREGGQDAEDRDPG
jgi:PRC-barrel domain